MTSIASSSLQVVFRKIVKSTSALESHTSVYIERTANCAKLLVLRMVNLITLFNLPRVLSKSCNGATLEACSCPLTDMGFQIFWLVISDTVIGNAIPFIFPYTKWLCSRRMNRFRSVMLPDNDLKGDFLVEDEYSESLVRQAVVLAGISVFPMVPLLATVSLGVEIWIDRIRIVRLCRSMKRDELHASYHVSKLLVVSCLVTILLFGAFCSFPYGMIFVNLHVNIRSCAVIAGSPAP